MFKLRSNWILTAVAVLAATALPLTSVYAQQQVGTAGAVNPAADASGRVLQVGSNVLFRERINTTSSGSLQLIFVDKTTLSIGPNSNLVIDEFVYNPNAGTGRMTVSLAKGLLRIVGGNVTHTEGATIKTPAATVGIRGGVQTTSHVNGTTNVINHFGKSTITSGGTTQTIYRPGFGSSVGSANTPPSAPAVVPQSVVNTTMQQLTSTSAQTGGAQSQPTNATASSAGLGQTNANLIPSQVQSLQGQTVSQSVGTLPPTTATVANADQVTQQGQQQATTEQAVQATAPVPTFFALQTIGVPYLPSSGFTAPGMYVSPLFGFRRGGVMDNGEGRFGSATLQAGLAISGEGEFQTSTFFVMSGGFSSLSADGSEQFHSAGFRATTRIAADQPMGAARGSADSVPGSEALDTDRIPTAVTLSQNDRNPLTGAVTPNTASFFAPFAEGNYTYSSAFAQIPLPAGVGESRSSEQLTGFVGGVMRTRHAASVSASSSSVGPSFPVVGGLVIDFSKERPQFQAVASIDKVANFLDVLDPNKPNEFVSAVLQVGNLATTRGRGAFIDDNLFGGREGINEPPGVDPQTQVSTTNASPLRRSGQAFATSKLVNAEGTILALDPGATFCVCEYTRWGAWSADNYRLNSDMSEERDRAHLMLWVAGRKSNPVDIPLVGTATYNGYMAGAIKNSASEYLAGSNFSYSANFGSPAASTMSVTDLDGVTYAGTLPFVRATNTISGSISGTNIGVGPLTGSATMDLNGAFFKGKTDPIKDVAGRFHITGNPSGPNFNYIGAGIFAGSR
jgi:hypothetical protein